MAQKGKAPRILIAARLTTWVKPSGRRATHSAAGIMVNMMMVLNNIAMHIFAKKYPARGAGSARLSFSRPCSRSMATATPNPNMPGPIIPKTVRPAKTPIAAFGSWRRAAPKNTTPIRRYTITGMSKNGTANEGARSMRNDSYLASVR
ncbi:MAG TPA: hypothetical protein VN924_09720 [Bryobacteraceae bacterium]|nr:hypothetical protein [Bryobacteraceae bacterium]